MKIMKKKKKNRRTKQKQLFDAVVTSHASYDTDATPVNYVFVILK